MPDKTCRNTYEVWRASDNFSERSWKDVVRDIIHKIKNVEERTRLLVTTQEMKEWAEEEVESEDLSGQVDVELHANGEHSQPSYA